MFMLCFVSFFLNFPPNLQQLRKIRWSCHSSCKNSLLDIPFLVWHKPFYPTPGQEKCHWKGRGVCWKQQFISFDNVSLGEFLDHSQAEALGIDGKSYHSHRRKRNPQIPRPQMEHQQISKVVLKNSCVSFGWCFNLRCCCCFKDSSDFLLHAQKTGGKEVRIQFCGVENSNEVDSCLYVKHSEFKRSISLTPEISVNQLVELHFRGWNSDQFSQNSHATLQKWRLASDDFSF